MSNLMQNNPDVFRKALQKIPEAIILIDESDIIIWYNDAVFDHLNIKKQNLCGRNFNNFFPWLIEKGMWREANIRLEIESNKIIECRIENLADSPENLKMILIRDITAAEKTDQALEEAINRNSYYENTFNSMDQGVQIIDKNGYVTFINPVQENFDGIKFADAIGKHIRDLYRLDDDAILLLQALKSGKPVIDQRQDYFSAVGKMASILCTSLPLFWGSELVGAVSITKDFSKIKELSEQILDLQNALNCRENPSADKAVKKKETFKFSDIITQSTSFQKIKDLAEKVASGTSPVFIYGETGSGKELFAQSIHNASSRRRKQFIAINCAAIPENLLESILFGTVKGAFTGATDRLGLFEQASEGTLFLDEINSMPLLLQAKLLRVIQEESLRRVGGNADIPVNPRIISSSNIEPLKSVEMGLLRSDLFYRLSVVCLSIPPLRERKEDIVLLSRYFIDKLNKRLNKQITGIEPAAFALLQEHNWPGNVRELEHVLEYSITIGEDGSTIKADDLPEIFSKYTPLPNVKNIERTSDTTPLLDQIELLEKDKILKILLESDGNITAASKKLSISRQCLQYRMKRLNIKAARILNY